MKPSKQKLKKRCEINEQAQINNEFDRADNQASKLRHFLELATLLAFHESFANTLT